MHYETYPALALDGGDDAAAAAAAPTAILLNGTGGCTDSTLTPCMSKQPVRGSRPGAADVNPRLIHKPRSHSLTVSLSRSLTLTLATLSHDHTLSPSHPLACTHSTNVDSLTVSGSHAPTALHIDWRMSGSVARLRSRGFNVLLCDLRGQVGRHTVPSSTAARHVTLHAVHRCLPRRPTHGALVLTTSSTTSYACVYVLR